MAPDATFYCWGDLSGLPEGLNDGMQFLKAALDEKVICVPGEFFDVNPGKRRAGRPSRFHGSTHDSPLGRRKRPCEPASKG